MKGAHKFCHKAGGVCVLHRFRAGSICQKKERGFTIVNLRRLLYSFHPLPVSQKYQPQDVQKTHILQPTRFSADDNDVGIKTGK